MSDQNQQQSVSADSNTPQQIQNENIIQSQPTQKENTYRLRYQRPENEKFDEKKDTGIKSWIGKISSKKALSQNQNNDDNQQNQENTKSQIDDFDQVNQMLESEKQRKKREEEELQQMRQELAQKKNEDHFFEGLSPQMREEFESRYRKEQILHNKLESAATCVSCKFISGTLLLMATAFHGFRVASIWKFYPLKEKIFNVAAGGVLLSLSYLNYKAGYETYMGKTMQIVEYRPSVGRRIIEGVNILSGGTPQNIEQQLKLEEEKQEIEQFLKEAEKNNPGSRIRA